jgi:hypothetical protein
MQFLFAGPTKDERKRVLSGDDLVRNAAADMMHAVTIAAPPELVWPWLMQMGAGRAGWYSYDWVDNGGNASATKIIPELQNVAPRDIMPSLPGVTDNFVVAAVQPEQDLILTVPAANGGNLVSWEFFLEPHGAGAASPWTQLATGLSFAAGERLPHEEGKSKTNRAD